MDHGHPLEFGYCLAPEARDFRRLVETARRSAGVDPDHARPATRRRSKGYLG